jgi:hypothetical protein
MTSVKLTFPATSSTAFPPHAITGDEVFAVDILYITDTQNGKQKISNK